MRKEVKRVTIFAVVIILGLSSFGFGQKEFINVNGKKVEIFTAGLENKQKGKPVIVFENGMASKYGNSYSVKIYYVTKQNHCAPGK